MNGARWDTVRRKGACCPWDAGLDPIPGESGAIYMCTRCCARAMPAALTLGERRELLAQQSSRLAAIERAETGTDDIRQRRRALQAAEDALPTGPKIPAWQLRVLLTRRDGEEIRRTAWHEAGHAAISLLAGHGIRAVGLNWRRDSAGRFHLASGASGASGFMLPRRTHRLPSITLAGPVAERMSGNRRSLHDEPAWEGDLRKYARLAGKRGSGSTGLQGDVRVVEAELRRSWRAVSALAAALLERGELDGDEAEQIVSQHLSRPLRDRLRQTA